MGGSRDGDRWGVSPEGASCGDSRGILPRRFYALVPIPKAGRSAGGAVGSHRPLFGLGPWVGAPVAPQQSRILRPVLPQLGDRSLDADRSVPSLSIVGNGNDPGVVSHSVASPPACGVAVRLARATPGPRPSVRSSPPARRGALLARAPRRASADRAPGPGGGVVADREA
jgi:hypothetical protein